MSAIKCEDCRHCVVVKGEGVWCSVDHWSKPRPLAEMALAKRQSCADFEDCHE